MIGKAQKNLSGTAMFAMAMMAMLLIVAVTVGVNSLLLHVEAACTLDLAAWERCAQHMHWATVAVYMVTMAYSLSLYFSKPTEKYLLMFCSYALMMLIWALLIHINGEFPLLMIAGQAIYIYICVFGVRLCQRLTQPKLPPVLAWIEDRRFHLPAVCWVGLYFLCSEMQLSVCRAVIMLLPLLLSMYVLSCAAAQQRRGALVLLAAMTVLAGMRPSVMPGTFSFFFSVESQVMRVMRMTMRAHELVFVLAAMLYVNREFAWQFAEKERLAAHLDELVQERTRKLVEAQQQRQSMMMNIFHDVRTPLAVMRGALDTIEANPAATEKMLPLMSTQLGFVTELTGDLFLAAKLEDGQVMLTCSRVNLSDVVREQGEQAGQLAGKAGIDLMVQIEPALMVWGERVRLAQIAQNLLTNAIYYTPKGGRVSITLAANGGEAELRVTDSGKGISPEDQVHIFDRYFHTTAENKHESSGLGLTIARNLMRLHRGTLLVESTLGQGTTFIARFALLEKEEKDHV